MDKNLLKNQCIEFIEAALRTAAHNGMDARQTAEFLLGELTAEPAKSHIELHFHIIETEEMIDRMQNSAINRDPRWEVEGEPDDDEEGPALGETD